MRLGASARLFAWNIHRLWILCPFTWYCILGFLRHTNNTTTKQRQVIATKSLTPGDIIGPSNGLPAEYVLDPVEILKCSNVAQKVLGIDSKGDGRINDEQQKRIDKEKMAFWIALVSNNRLNLVRRESILLIHHQTILPYQHNSKYTMPTSYHYQKRDQIHVVGQKKNEIHY